MKKVSVDVKLGTIEELKKQIESGIIGELSDSEKEKLDTYNSNTCLSVPIESKSNTNTDDEEDETISLFTVAGKEDEMTFKSISNGLRSTRSILTSCYPDYDDIMFYFMIDYSNLFHFINNLEEEDIKVLISTLYSNYRIRIALI